MTDPTKARCCKPGDVFGRLTLLDRPAPRKMRLHCVCGKEVVTYGSNVLAGRTTSCGCFRRETARALRNQLRHGLSESPTYSSWAAMKARCSLPSSGGWSKYGAMGVTVADRWDSFENFLADMGERPLGTSIDRIDNSKGYEPGNCRWATAIEQATNRRTVILLTHEGRTLSVAGWGRELCIPASTIRTRLSKGWAVARALSKERSHE